MSRLKPKLLPELKRGEYFSFELHLIKNKVPMVVAVEDIKCQFRNVDDQLINDASIQKLSEGHFLIFVNDTSKWPTGMLFFDVFVNYEDKPFSTTTYQMEILPSITR